MTGLTGGDFAIGSERPRSFPRLATPTPQVNWVLYPEHSFPTSKHCEQYGLLRSHLTPRLVQVKQSSAAPPAGARLLRLRTAAASDLGFDGVGSGTVILMKVQEYSTLDMCRKVEGRKQLQVPRRVIEDQEAPQAWFM